MNTICPHCGKELDRKWASHVLASGHRKSSPERLAQLRGCAAKARMVYQKSQLCQKCRRVAECLREYAGKELPVQVVDGKATCPGCKLG